MGENKAQIVGLARCGVRVSSASKSLFPDDRLSIIAKKPACMRPLGTVGSAGHRRLAAAALILVGALWGAGFFFSKLAFAELPVSQVALYRYAIAAFALLPVAVFRRRLPRSRDIPHFLLTGFLIVPGSFLLHYQGLALTSASSAALIVGALPLLLALCSMWFLGERLGRLGWFAIGLSTLGVIFVVGVAGHGSSWLGNGMVLLSLLPVVGWVFLSKPLVRRYTPLVSTAYLMLFGTLMLLPISLFRDGVPRLDISSTVLLSVLMLGLGCSAVTHALWNWGVTRVPTSSAGVYTNVEPLFGAMLSVGVLHESLSTRAAFGGALIIVAAVIISLRGSPHAGTTPRTELRGYGSQEYPGSPREGVA